MNQSWTLLAIFRVRLLLLTMSVGGANRANGGMGGPWLAPNCRLTFARNPPPSGLFKEVNISFLENNMLSVFVMCCSNYGLRCQKMRSASQTAHCYNSLETGQTCVLLEIKKFLNVLVVMLLRFLLIAFFACFGCIHRTEKRYNQKSWFPNETQYLRNLIALLINPWI